MGRVCVAVLALAIASCGSRSEAPPEMLEEEMAPPPMAKRATGGAPSPSAPMADMAMPSSAPLQTPADTPKPQRPTRLVYYNGYGKLRVTTPQETLEQAVKIAEDAGGYVETFSGTRVVLRVPVERFRTLLDQLLGLGEVLQKSITAQDITEAFTSTQLRLKTLKASRDRLIELLARARNEQEKLTILREIKRLTEQVDQLEMRLKTLATLASFSRITLEAEPKQQDPYRREQEWVAAFRWIRELSPFRRDVAYDQDHLELELPDDAGMVSLDDFEHWMAESADGAQIWSHERDNEPQGDDDFWLTAIRERLGPAYGEGETMQVGEFSVLRLIDDGPDGYRYLVAVNADDDELQVVEVYYPSPEHEERYGAAVRATLEKGGS